MILVDTSIWADHIAASVPALFEALQARRVVMHPFVIGELALGNLRDRPYVLGTLKGLPAAAVAFDDEVFSFIEHHSLYGSGIGYVDAHLIVAARLMPDTKVWTKDRRLQAVASRLGIAHDGSTN